MALDPLDALRDVDSKFWTKGRLSTYTHWPFTDEDGACTPERMAAAGFYYVGDDENPDAVECFICRKQMDGWDATDDPWQEHVKHQKDCPYVLLNKPNEMEWTIDDLFNFIEVYDVAECTHKVNEFDKDIKLKLEERAKQIPKIYKLARKNRKGGK